MRRVRIFVSKGVPGPGPVTVGGQAAKHVLKVLRMKPGQSLVLFDGTGGEFPATLTACGKDSIELSVSPRLDISRESPLRTRLAVAVPRGERMDLVVQKATELGVSEILPVLTERTVVRLGGSRAERRRLHWQNIAASACEQCGRNTLPDVASVQALAALIGGLGAPDSGELRVMPEPLAGDALAIDHESVSTVTLLVGPEGGFTEKEIGAARAAGFQTINLGPRILRTETAAVGMLTVVQWTLGDMRVAGNTGPRPR